MMKSASGNAVYVPDVLAKDFLCLLEKHGGVGEMGKRGAKELLCLDCHVPEQRE